MSRITDTIKAARSLTAGGAAPSAAQVADALAVASDPEPDDSETA